MSITRTQSHHKEGSLKRYLCDLRDNESNSMITSSHGKIQVSCSSDHIYYICSTETSF